MALTWHGREHETVWEQEIVRYWFIATQEVKERGQFRDIVRIGIGGRIKINKREAKQVSKNGYFLYNSHIWNPATGEYEWGYVPLYGTLQKEVETRYLKQVQIAPDEFVSPSRKKKLLTATPVPATVPVTPQEEATDDTGRVE